MKVNATGPSFEDVAYHVLFDLFTDSGGVPLGWVSFNPQPEPPFLPAGAGAMGFEFHFTSLSTATLQVQVCNAQGQALAFTRVPESASWALLVVGMFGLRAARATRNSVP